jgi:hypothetical protein
VHYSWILITTYASILVNLAPPSLSFSTPEYVVPGVLPATRANRLLVVSADPFSLHPSVSHQTILLLAWTVYTSFSESLLNLLKTETKSKLRYNRVCIFYSVLSWSPTCDLRPDFYYCQTVGGLLMWGVLSDERSDMSCSQSRVWVPPDSWPNFIVSDCRLPQLGGSGPRIYIPVVTLGTRFAFRRVLRIAELWWRYSLKTDRSVCLIGVGLRRRSRSWLQSPRGPWPRFLFSTALAHVSKWGLLRHFLYVIYTNSVRTLQETHYVTAMKSNQLILSGLTIVVSCESLTKHTYALLEQN